MNKIKIFTRNNFREIPQVKQFLSEEEKVAIENVSRVLPFRVNNYVVNELINWENIPNDPLYLLTFPQKEMLKEHHYILIAEFVKMGNSDNKIKEFINSIRYELNPHPAGQLEENIPTIGGLEMQGVQHKYDQTLLFFPFHGQTCHSYCTFCFRWPQFTGIDELKLARQDTGIIINYLKQHPEITDILFTGGDPMTMTANRLRQYVRPLLEHDLPNIQTIRIGTKSLSYWPYRYLTDKDADDVLFLFEEIVRSGKNLAFMAHFNHVNELKTEAVQKASARILSTGAQIRTQAPLLRHINDNAGAWKAMWNRQVNMGMVPYYMFLARNTGAQHYFAVPLDRAYNIFTNAYQDVSGIARTVRGPSMSAYPGKIHIVGTSEIKGEKVYMLKFIQARKASWVNKPFFANYDPNAIWLDDLRPAFNKKYFFFEEELMGDFQE